jgi:hypothetical protein
MAYQDARFENDAIEETETTVMDVRAQATERTDAFRGIIRSSGVDGLLVCPEDDPHFELPQADRFYAGSAFKAGELLIASGLFAATGAKIA